MKSRFLGADRRPISAIGLGCMALTGTYGNVPRESAVTLLKAGLEVGVTFFDTADVYGHGANEELLGEVISGKEDAAIATKFGFRDPSVNQGRLVCGDPQYVRYSCERSLLRLKRERLDLLIYHRIDRHVPLEETIGMMKRLQSEGKVRGIGLSEPSADDLNRASGVATIDAIESEYSFWERKVEAEVLPTCRKLGVTFVAYSPLGRGYATSNVELRLKEGDFRQKFPRFAENNINANKWAINEFARLAASSGLSPAQLALAWLLSRGDDVIPIPGTTNPVRLGENVSSADIVLSPELLSDLDALANSATIHGDRAPPEMMELLSS